MSPRRLRLDRALAALPETEELLPLRDALIGASREDAERAWAASEAYATLDTRLADPRALEAQVAEIAERVRSRVEAVLRHSVRALRAVEEGDPAGAARALVAAGEVEEGERRLDEAERYYRKALELGRKPRDRRAEGLALRRLGRVARARGDLHRAARLYGEGLAVAEAERDVEGAVVACQGLGNVCVDRGAWAEAREWYRRGMGLLDPETPSRNLWLSHVNLAAMELRLGVPERTAEHLDAAAALIRALDDASGTVYLESGRGRLHVERGEPTKGEAAYRRGLEAPADPAERGTLLANLAEVLLLQGRTGEAERTARELEALAITHRVTPLLAEVYRTLGTVARARGDQDAFVFYEQALDVCRDHGLPPVEVALTQHEYGLWEAGRGMEESARARMEAALAIYERIGARAEAERARGDLARLPDAGDGTPTVETER